MSGAILLALAGAAMGFRVLLRSYAWKPRGEADPEADALSRPE
jgi:hypothetical protein